MNAQILKLCRRLDKFTIENLVMISEMESRELLQILKELVSEGKITHSNGVYFFVKKETKPHKYSIFEFFNSNTIDMAIRCFCLEIPAYKAFKLLGIGENSINKLYNIFRELLYNRQMEILNTCYSAKPQKGRLRIFFDTSVYFYIYNNQVFVSEKLFNSSDEKSFTKEEIKEFKKVYCYLTRCVFHNQIKHNLVPQLAEFIWRRNKGFEPLYFKMKNILGEKQ